MSDPAGKERKRPLQQLVVRVEGSTDTDRIALVAALRTALDRFSEGEDQGRDDGDDFGYEFEFLSGSRSLFKPQTQYQDREDDDR